MGWVKPYTLGDLSETVLRENAFFAMLRVKAKSKLMSYLTKEHCVIVLKVDPQRKVVATADQESGLQEQWEWIEQNLIATLTDDENLRGEMITFLESKFEIFADMEATQKAKAEADAIFKSRFHLEDEMVIHCTFASLRFFFFDNCFLLSFSQTNISVHPSYIFILHLMTLFTTWLAYAHDTETLEKNLPSSPRQLKKITIARCGLRVLAYFLAICI